jgi:lysophosphatidic acid acyltransferase/lysophosphatidylinositol acyltransferase
MAVPLVIVMPPLGLLFLLSGLIVNTVQVTLPPARSIDETFRAIFGRFLVE